MIDVAGAATGYETTVTEHALFINYCIDIVYFQFSIIVLISK